MPDHGVAGVIAAAASSSIGRSDMARTLSLKLSSLAIGRLEKLSVLAIRAADYLLCHARLR